MPMYEQDRKKVLDYCDRDLPKAESVAEMFSFIDDQVLFERIKAEFNAARYVYKLGEALNVSDERLYAHVKFQIVQYASIYEAVIVWLLWDKYAGHTAVIDIEFHNAFRKAASLPRDVQILTASNEEVSLCVNVKQKTPKVSIKFDDKVDAAVKIGFLDQNLGQEIKNFYKLRNAIHIENAIKNDLTYELPSSLLAFRRMQPFTSGVRGFLSTGTLPDDARPEVPKDAVSPAETAEEVARD